MTEEEYQLLDEYLTSNYGFCFPPHKMEILESRLKQRIKALKFTSFMDYYLFLQFNSNGTQETTFLIRLLTNNETYFFRETAQMDALVEKGIEALQQSKQNAFELKICIAGCSSGEEAYTLNIYLKEHSEKLFGMKPFIHAFDLDDQRVAIAKSGEYGPNSIRSLAEDKISKYFNIPQPEKYHLKPEYRTGIEFSLGNILSPLSYARHQPFDVIFCRNVLIYFSEPALHRAVKTFASALRPGGILFLGHSESIIGISPSFETIRLNNSVVYQRVSA